jgi:hypothetical protein
VTLGVGSLMEHIMLVDDDFAESHSLAAVLDARTFIGKKADHLAIPISRNGVYLGQRELEALHPNFIHG